MAVVLNGTRRTFIHLFFFSFCFISHFTFFFLCNGGVRWGRSASAHSLGFMQGSWWGLFYEVYLILKNYAVDFGRIEIKVD